MHTEYTGCDMPLSAIRRKAAFLQRDAEWKDRGGVDGVGLVFMTGMVGGEGKCGIRYR